jgi:hypothetical protein
MGNGVRAGLLLWKLASIQGIGARTEQGGIGDSCECR